MGREHSAHRKKEEAVFDEQTAFVYAGDDLLSHALSRAVQSARRGLTSVFGMGTGISHGGWPAYNLQGAYANYFKNALDLTNAGSLTARKIEASGRLGSIERDLASRQPLYRTAQQTYCLRTGEGLYLNDEVHIMTGSLRTGFVDSGQVRWVALHRVYTILETAPEYPAVSLHLPSGTVETPLSTI